MQISCPAACHSTHLFALLHLTNPASIDPATPLPHAYHHGGHPQSVTHAVQRAKTRMGTHASWPSHPPPLTVQNPTNSHLPNRFECSRQLNKCRPPCPIDAPHLGHRPRQIISTVSRMWLKLETLMQGQLQLQQMAPCSHHHPSTPPPTSQGSPQPSPPPSLVHTHSLHFLTWCTRGNYMKYGAIKWTGTGGVARAQAASSSSSLPAPCSPHGYPTSHATGTSTAWSHTSATQCGQGLWVGPCT